MMPFFAWLENTQLSIGVREAPTMWAFPFVLVLHAIGMAFLVGPNIAVNLRVIGFARGVPLSLMEKFFPIMTTGFLINAVSGFLLLMAYPAKALTNPVFYLKLILIAGAIVETWFLRDRVLRKPEFDFGRTPRHWRVIAAATIVIWAGAVTAGRLLAYTHSRLMSTDSGDSGY